MDYTTCKANATDHTTCKANFQGSAPAMEPVGAEHIFRRSAELHNLWYTEFYGDGGQQDFSRVKSVYEDSGIEVGKKECIGHGEIICKQNFLIANEL